MTLRGDSTWMTAAKLELQDAAVLAKSLSDTNRLRIVLCVSQGKKAVSAIVEELGLSQPLVSHHLKELKRSLLVTVERDGPFIYYELADSRIIDVLQTLSGVATDLLTARKTFGGPGGTLTPMEPLTKIVAGMDPKEALAEIARVLKQLLADLDEEARTEFLMNLVAQSEGDKVSSLVHL